MKRFGAVFLTCAWFVASACSADKAIEEGTDCDQVCPVGAQMEFAKEATGSCGADGSYTAAGAVKASGQCQGSGECQVVCKYPACGESQDLVISKDEFRCEAVDPCADVDCDLHGECRIVNDAPSCKCDPGYVASGTNCDLIATPVVSLITPATGVVGKKATFTVVGENLPLTLSVESDSCDGMSFTDRSETQQVYTCTPSTAGVAARKVYTKAGGELLYEDEATFVVECDDCEIDGQCYKSKAVNPDNVCESCDPGEDKNAWTFGAGLACDDDLFCTGPGICDAQSNSCNATESPCVSQNDGVFCNGETACDEDQDECIEPGNPCPESQICVEASQSCVDEFRVNSTAIGNQEAAFAAGGPDGHFVVVWKTGSVPGGSTYSDIALRLFAKDGQPLTDDIIVTAPEQAQEMPSVCVAPDGSMVLLWISQAFQNAPNKGRLQRIASDGTLVGTPIALDPDLPWSKQGGAAICNPDGSFVVAGAPSESSEPQHVYVQAFSEEGESSGPGYPISEYYPPSAVGMVSDVRTTTDSSANKVISWVQYTEGDTALRLLARSTTGMALPPASMGGMEVAAFTTEVDGGRHDVALDGIGGIWFAFIENIDLGSSNDFPVQVVRAQSAFMKLGDPVVMDEGVNLEAGGPSIAVRNDGSGVVVWTAKGQGIDGDAVFGRRFGPDGNPVGDKFQAELTTTADQRANDVVMTPNGSFFVIWTHYGTDRDIFVRRFPAQ